jgi:hypothetical protein
LRAAEIASHAFMTYQTSAHKWQARLAVSDGPQVPFALLALLDLRPDRTWTAARNPLMDIAPIMELIRDHYQKTYAPNTRETMRR